ncbi:MAG: hypothetical protein UIC65_01315 [Alphaproteobacteria bacterium]|nr:hypothetical protein [Alphaproteobacteria bacterium]
MTKPALCAKITFMKLKKILLPLTFLGLSPTARAADNTQTTDSVPQNKTEQTTNFSNITLIPENTINFFDAQEDSVRHAVNDSIGSAEIKKVHNKLIETYNANPDKYNINQIIDLLNRMDRPDKIYEQLRLSMHHANYFANNITPQLQNKLNITDKSDIIITAANKRAHDMPEYDAFRFAITGKYFDKIQNPDIILSKALNVALGDITKILKQSDYEKCIVNIAEYVFLHQDNPKLTKLYSDIFVATAKTIREYNEQTDNQDKYLASMNTLVPLIEKYNARIMPGSMMDKELNIKKPHDYVINQYNDIFTRITLAKIYNEAYLKYMLQSHDLTKRVFGNNTLHNIYMNYMTAIDLQTIARTQQLSSEQQTKLNNILKQHPEIALFEPYFASVYFNTAERQKIRDFMTKVRFSKNQTDIVPNQISTLLQKLQNDADAQRQLIIENLINMPDLTLTLPHKVSYSEIMRQSSFAPTNVHDSIDYSLRKQYDDVSVQKQSLERITKNNNLNIINEQNER